MQTLKTPTHQKFVVPPRPYPMAEHLGYFPGHFTPDPRVTPEAERLMESGEAEAFLERSWDFDNPEPDFPR